MPSDATWATWLGKFGPEMKVFTLPKAVLEQKWEPTCWDRKAAWQLYTHYRMLDRQLWT